MSQALILDQRLRAQVQTERKITKEVLLTIREIDITESYKELKYASLYAYLTEGIKYSEGAAHRRISASRVLGQLPEVAPKIQEGKITLSQLALVQTAINQEQKKSKTKVSQEKKQQVMKDLEGKNYFNSQKVLMEAFPDFEPPKPKVVPSRNNKIKVNLEFSEQDWKDIQDLMAAISHKVPDQKIESALLYWAQAVRKKQQGPSRNQSQAAGANPTQKSATNDNAVRDDYNQPKKQKDSQQQEKVPASAKPVKAGTESSLSQSSQVKSAATQESPPIRRQSSGRKHISIKIRRQVFEEASHQCSYVSPITGERCECRHFLEIDHEKPVAFGGSDEIENLRVLCRSHNQMMAKQMHLSGQF